MESLWRSMYVGNITEHNVPVFPTKNIKATLWNWLRTSRVHKHHCIDTKKSCFNEELYRIAVYNIKQRSIKKVIYEYVLSLQVTLLRSITLTKSNDRAISEEGKQPSQNVGACLEMYNIDPKNKITNKII